MAVNIDTSPGPLFHSLTSPPPKPEPSPPADLIAKVIQFPDRELMITIPFPDTVELVTDVLNEHLDSPYEAGSVKSIYVEIDKDVTEFVKGFKGGESHFSPSPYVQGGPKAGAIFKLGYDSDQPLNFARLELRRRIGPDFGIWSVRLEFSASKAGPAGLVQLIAQIENAVGFLRVDRLLETFKLSRVDAAVDCIGATPLDLIAHVPKPGKRVAYVGDNGVPETVYLYGRKKPLDAPPSKLSVKTRGPLRLTLYERRDHARQLCLPSPYGDCPVTRAEVSRRWTKHRPLLSEIAEIPNLFSDRRVAYAPPIGGGTSAWQKFCMAAFGAGVDAASFSWLPGRGGKFRKLYLGCVGDLVDQDCWGRWNDGLVATGLTQWAPPSPS